MKLFYIFIFSAMLFAGCSKSTDVTPQNNTSKSSSGGSSKTTTGGGSSQTPPDTTPKLTHDDSIHMAAYNIKPQGVKTSVSGTTLTLAFNENVDLLFTEEGYQTTSAVHLQEDFSKTLLSGFDFTTVAEGGNTTLNWVDDNLNNVVLKTVTDTIINRVKMVKINVHRPFTFYKDYPSSQAALDQQTVFLNKKLDSVAFTSYSYYNQKNYPPVSASANLVYSK
jgi:hypothetical protein